ncbi:acyl carrier protein [Mesonia aquimarina]|uniref:acyl carrier protein n=1 Tax=Mesonia aquimarina TaxID=1504967 RepID=UPI000EF568B1|nr:acyl carrier protein [Mesonia aquimarina]
MNINTFIEKIEAEFDELEPGTLQKETSFKDLDEWSSMHALIIIALIDTEYDVVLTGEDLTRLSSVEDLYTIVKERK